MARTRKQRESGLKLARQGFMIVAMFVGVGVWSSSHSLIAGVVTFGVVLVGLELVLVLPGFLRRLRFQQGGAGDIDSMSWHDFEKYVASVFQDKGYRTRLTPFYDYGADVIADGHGERVAVQVKHSSRHDIGNKGVQQVAAGVNYYKGTRAVVVTNRHFTQSAISLARANNVELWDRDRLIRESLGTHRFNASSDKRTVSGSRR